MRCGPKEMIVGVGILLRLKMAFSRESLSVLRRKRARAERRDSKSFETGQPFNHFDEDQSMCPVPEGLRPRASDPAPCRINAVGYFKRSNLTAQRSWMLADRTLGNQ
jgi:hypothetical protein